MAGRGGHSALVPFALLVVALVSCSAGFEVGELSLTNALPGVGCVSENGLKCTSVKSLVDTFEGVVEGRNGDVSFMEEEEEANKLVDPQASVSKNFQGPLDMMFSDDDDAPDSAVADPKPKKEKPAHHYDDDVDDDDAPTNGAVDEEDYGAEKMAEEAQRVEDLRLAKRERAEARKAFRRAKAKEREIRRERKKLESHFGHHERHHEHHRRHERHHHSEHHRHHNHHGRRTHLRKVEMEEEISRQSTVLGCDKLKDAAAEKKCADAQAIADIGDQLVSGTLTMTNALGSLKGMGAEKLSLGDAAMKTNWNTLFNELCAGDLSSVTYGHGEENGCGMAMKKMIEGTVAEAAKVVESATGSSPASATADAGATSDAESSIKDEIRAEVKKEIEGAKAEAEKRLQEELGKLRGQASGEILSTGELGELYGKVQSGDTSKKDALKKMDDLGLNVKDLNEDDVPSVLKNILKKDGPLVKIQVGLESGAMSKDDAINQLKDAGLADPDSDTSIDDLKKLMIKLGGETALAQHKIIQASTEQAIKEYMKKMEKEGGVSPAGIKKEVLSVIHDLGKNKTEVRDQGRMWRKSLGKVTDKKLNGILDKLKSGDMTFEAAAAELQKEGGAEAKLTSDDAIKFLTAELDARSTIRSQLKRGGPGTVKAALKKEILSDVIHAQAQAAGGVGKNGTDSGDGEGGSKGSIDKDIVEALKKQREEFKEEMKKDIGTMVQRATAKASIQSMKMSNETAAELETLKKKLEAKEVTPEEARKKMEDLGLVDPGTLSDDGVGDVIQSILDHKKARDEDRDSLRTEVEKLKAELTESVKADAAKSGNGTASAEKEEPGMSKNDNIRTSLKKLFNKAESGTPEEVAELIKSQMEAQGLVVTEGAADGSQKVKVDEASFEHAIYGESDGEMSFVCFVPE